MTDPDQLPALPESEYLLARPARPYENEYITSFDGYSDDDMRSYALTAIATERARADALEAALKPLAALGLYALDETRGDYIGSDLSGGDIQDKAEALGLLTRVEVKDPCSEEYCSCAEYYDKDEWPVQCLRYSPVIADARALLEKT